MARNLKCRKVCFEFKNRIFHPDYICKEYMIVTMEEIESIRLCDYEGLDQKEAAEIMQISRGTLQRILYSARKKIANALCEGKGIRIEGGNYQVKSSDVPCIKNCKECQRKRKQ